MENLFQEQLNTYIQQTNLSVRRLAMQACIPHQTLHNWLNGRRPRWHPDLDSDLYRLGQILDLNKKEIEQLLRFAGCRPMRIARNNQENTMTAKHELPEGWFAAGANPDSYDMYVDETTRYDDRPSLYLATENENVDFGTVMQTFKADKYVGKRLRYRAMVRTAGVIENNEDRWVGLWMRVDGERGKCTAFDNMRERPVTGTTDWAEYDVVLDVSEDSEYLAFGMLLVGTGKAWFTNIQFEVVGDDVPVTGESREYSMSDGPVNLFADG